MEHGAEQAELVTGQTERTLRVRGASGFCQPLDVRQVMRERRRAAIPVVPAAPCTRRPTSERSPAPSEFTASSSRSAVSDSHRSWSSATVIPVSSERAASRAATSVASVAARPVRVVTRSPSRRRGSPGVPPSRAPRRRVCATRGWPSRSSPRRRGGTHVPCPPHETSSIRITTGIPAVAWIGAKLLEDFNPRDLRHEEVEQNQIRLGLASQVQTDLAVSRRFHDKPTLLKADLAGPSKKSIVFDYENHRRVAHDSCSTYRRRATCVLFATSPPSSR